jgi:hypothetical protein
MVEVLPDTDGDAAAAADDDVADAVVVRPS